MASRLSSTGCRQYGIGAGWIVAAALSVACAIDDRETAVFDSRPTNLPGDEQPPARECIPDEAICVSSTQRRACSSDGRWLAVETCPQACVGDACGMRATRSTLRIEHDGAALLGSGRVGDGDRVSQRLQR
jgi:hypothetical protein